MNSTRRYMIAGMLALTPLWITWLVLGFLFGLLAQFGKPLVLGTARAIQGSAPSLSEVLLHPWFESVLAVLAMLVIIYFLGWTTTHVLGARLLAWFDGAIDRIPLAKTVYSSTKKMLAALQAQPEGTQRVVFISFPSPDMKTIGLVTRTVTDETTGRPMAIVYVPTSPNPTSGYMEIVPVEDVIETDWTIDQAMQFIVTGGTSSPDRLRLTPARQ